MIVFVMGASGAGKSACLPLLRKLTSGFLWYDFDEGGVPPDADRGWRQERTRQWLRVALENEKTGTQTGVCGGAIVGEILACPEAASVQRVALCLLDCDDVVRVDRLRERGSGGATMETLSWAAWQRVHIVDPQWYPSVIHDESNTQMQWERWLDLERGSERWPATYRVDTTHLTIEQVAEKVARWTAAQPS